MGYTITRRPTHGTTSWEIYIKGLHPVTKGYHDVCNGDKTPKNSPKTSRGHHGEGSQNLQVTCGQIYRRNNGYSSGRGKRTSENMVTLSDSRRVSGLDPFPRILPVDEKHKPSPTPSVNTKEIVRSYL